MSGTFENKKHAVGINAFHLEWCTKYRYKLLSGNWVSKVLRESIAHTAKRYGMQIIALETGAEHIHLFVHLPASMSVSAALQLLKGRSSRDIFSACSFRGILHKGHFWSRGNFYRSVSNVSSSTVYGYISGHRHKELQNTICSARQEAEQLSILSFV
ncbi:MAG: IS200/IS605 family transposase [Candidatus Micrarchaeota archaeon]